ncbi:dipeptide epimerase [Fodinibius salsisoli]|uniref:Dipeptide epimerase n=1 Tax=Fodinibius salsisoli TaxID=2820877 RepID=A0ABT3PP05_9BACT|nr:dipeptide epimerase [Fodinibius salsisoli]MCW9707580.1 dipeptide epimerase [Fodinibius salsisoli]
MLQLEFKPYILKKKHIFKISGASRTKTPILLTKIRYRGIEGLGEASMPPLYGETIDSATDFLHKLDLSGFQSPFEVEKILQAVDAIALGNTAVKASIDIALHDLVSKLLMLPLHQYLGLPACTLATSKTIGINSPETIQKRVEEASEFNYLKIKLGTGTKEDKAIIRAIREVSDQPLYVDANQGWEDPGEALAIIKWLSDKGVVFIEQPLPKDDIDGQIWLKNKSPLPIVGDEGVQRLPDMAQARELYHGVNIKLMKSTGIHEARKMIHAARGLGLKVLLGCMSETSCAITAAAHLGTLADWVDLDGNLNVTNDPYQASEVADGKIRLPEDPGIGLKKCSWKKI